MSSDFYIARLVLVEQQGLCKVFTAPRSKTPPDRRILRIKKSALSRIAEIPGAVEASFWEEKLSIAFFAARSGALDKRYDANAY
jgi:hypothetical protein